MVLGVSGLVKRLEGVAPTGAGETAAAYLLRKIAVNVAPVMRNSLTPAPRKSTRRWQYLSPSTIVDHQKRQVSCVYSSNRRPPRISRNARRSASERQGHSGVIQRTRCSMKGAPGMRGGHIKL
jgi:hypothetical protein